MLAGWLLQGLALSSSPSRASAWQSDRQALTGCWQAEQPGWTGRTRGRILANDVLSEGYWRDSPWDCPFWVNPCRQVVRLCIKRLAAGRGYRQSRQVVLCQHIPTDSYTGTLYLTAAVTDLFAHTPLTAFYTGTHTWPAAITFPSINTSSLPVLRYCTAYTKLTFPL